MTNKKTMKTWPALLAVALLILPMSALNASAVLMPGGACKCGPGPDQPQDGGVPLKSGGGSKWKVTSDMCKDRPANNCVNKTGCLYERSGSNIQYMARCVLGSKK